jgi:hypothetical protein
MVCLICQKKRRGKMVDCLFLVGTNAHSPQLVVTLKMAIVVAF